MKNETRNSVKSHFSLLTSRFSDVPPLLLFLALAAVICAPVLAGRVPVASNTLGLWGPWSQLPHEPISNSAIADSALLYLPWNVYERESIASGEWPLWNPFNFAGSSFAANSQNQLYYPLTWLLWLLPLSGAIQFLAIFNTWFAAAGMYLLCRHFGASRPAACLAGLGFGGSGMLQLSLELPGVATPYGWLPWMLYATDRAIVTATPRWMALSALACGVQLVSGNLQWCIYSYFALGLWILWRTAANPLRSEWQRATGALFRGVIPLIGGVAIAAIHLTPVLELSSLSTRGEARISSRSAPVYDLLRLLMPGYFGTSVGNVGSPLIFNDLWYVGIGTLALALLATVLSRRPERWLWAGLAMFAVLVAFGIGPFLYVRWLPGLGGLLPSRIGYLFIFAVCLLAAQGLDAWIKSSAVRPSAALLTLLALVTALGSLIFAAQLFATASSNQELAPIRGQQIFRASAITASLAVGLALFPLWSIYRERRTVIPFRAYLLHGAMISIVLLALLPDLLTIAPDYNQFVDPADIKPRSPAISWLHSQAAQGRVMGLGADGGVPVLVPNSDLLYELQSVAGYDSLHTARYENYWAAVDPTIKVGGSSTPYSNVFVRPQAYSSTLASLLNVRYVASVSKLATSRGFTAVYSGEINIYENESVMPRAYVVDQAEVLPQNRLLRRLTSPDFDPKGTVLLDSAESPPNVSFNISPEGSPGTVKITGYKRNSVELDVNMSRPGWLVLTDQNYPGWSATVDGSPRQVFSADYLLRAVQVGLGRHLVTFAFLPTNFWPSLVLTLAALAVTLAAMAVGGRPFLRQRPLEHRLANLC